MAYLLDYPCGRVNRFIFGQTVRYFTKADESLLLKNSCFYEYN